MNIIMNTYKNENGLVATIPCSWGPSRAGFQGRGVPLLPPPWDQGSGAWLQGNAATNPF